MTKTFVIKFNGILSFCLDIKISNTSIHRFSVIWERKTNDTQSASLSLHINIYMPYKKYFDTFIEMWNSCSIIIISTNTKKNTFLKEPFFYVYKTVSNRIIQQKIEMMKSNTTYFCNIFAKNEIVCFDFLLHKLFILMNLYECISMHSKCTYICRTTILFQIYCNVLWFDAYFDL